MAPEPEASARDPRIVSGSDYGIPDPRWKRIDWPAHRPAGDRARPAGLRLQRPLRFNLVLEEFLTGDGAESG